MVEYNNKDMIIEFVQRLLLQTNRISDLLVSTGHQSPRDGNTIIVVSVLFVAYNKVHEWVSSFYLKATKNHSQVQVPDRNCFQLILSHSKSVYMLKRVISKLTRVMGSMGVGSETTGRASWNCIGTYTLGCKSRADWTVASVREGILFLPWLARLVG